MNYDKTQAVKKFLLIVDLDDTVAHTNHRQHLLPDWDAFHAQCDKDQPNTELINIIKEYAYGDDVSLVFITGRTRSKDVETKTKNWLSAQGLTDPVVEFRKPGSFLKTDVLKGTIAQKILEKNGCPEDMQFIIVEDTQSVIDRFHKKFPQYKTNSVLVEIDNAEKNEAQELKELFESLGIQSNVVIGEKKPKI